MVLEPVMPALGDDDNHELRDFLRRFWWTLPLTAVVFVLAILGARCSQATS
jgi:Cu+-exporting ATPase